MKPLISVIIPTYQRCNKLKVAIESVLSQTYDNYEILIIDDGSKDGTEEMVKSFKDKRIFYSWQNNSGCPANPRNKGIKAAKGDWIAFLDSDDWWVPDKLKNCMHYNSHKVDLIYHDLEIISKEKKLFKRKNIKTRQLKKPILTDLLLSGNIISNSSVIVRKSLLVSVGYLDERKELTAAEDYHTWLKISKLTDKFNYIPQRLGYYFEHSQNLSKKNMSIPSRNAVSEFRQFLDIKENLNLEANIKYRAANFELKKNDFVQAKKNLLFVIKNGDNAIRFKSVILLIKMLLR